MGCSASNAAKEPLAKEHSLVQSPIGVRDKEVERALNHNLDVEVFRGLDYPKGQETSKLPSISLPRLRSVSLQNLNAPSDMKNSLHERMFLDGTAKDVKSSSITVKGSPTLSRGVLANDLNSLPQPIAEEESFKRSGTAGNHVRKLSIHRKITKPRADSKHLTEQQTNPSGPGTDICKIVKTKSNRKKQSPRQDKIEENVPNSRLGSEPQSPTLSILKMRSGSQHWGLSRGFSGHQQDLLSRLPSVQSSSKRIGSSTHTVRVRNRRTGEQPQPEAEVSINQYIKADKRSLTLKEFDHMELNSPTSQRLEIPIQHQGSLSPSENKTRSGLLKTYAFRSTLNNLDIPAENFGRTASLMNLKTADNMQAKNRLPGITIQITPVEPHNQRDTADSKVVKGFDFSDVLNWSDVDEPEIPFMGPFPIGMKSASPLDMQLSGSGPKKQRHMKPDGLQGLLELLDEHHEVSVVHVPSISSSQKLAPSFKEQLPIDPRFLQDIPSERPKFDQQGCSMKLNPSLVFKRPKNERLGAVKVRRSPQALLENPYLTSSLAPLEGKTQSPEEHVTPSHKPVPHEPPSSGLRKRPQRQRSGTPGLLRRFTCPEQ